MSPRVPTARWEETRRGNRCSSPLREPTGAGVALWTAMVYSAGRGRKHTSPRKDAMPTRPFSGRRPGMLSLGCAVLIFTLGACSLSLGASAPFQRTAPGSISTGSAAPGGRGQRGAGRHRLRAGRPEGEVPAGRQHPPHRPRPILRNPPLCGRRSPKAPTRTPADRSRTVPQRSQRWDRTAPPSSERPPGTSAANSPRPPMRDAASVRT